MFVKSTPEYPTAAKMFILTISFSIIKIFVEKKAQWSEIEKRLQVSQTDDFDADTSKREMTGVFSIFTAHKKVAYWDIKNSDVSAAAEAAIKPKYLTANNDSRDQIDKKLSVIS